MATKESTERALLMAGQADATAKANYVQAIMGQEARIDEIVRELAVSRDIVGKLSTRISATEAKLGTRIETLEAVVAILNQPKKKAGKRENKPQRKKTVGGPDGGGN